MTITPDAGQRVVGVTIPVPLVDAVDRAAAEELLTRAAWMRRAIADQLRQRGNHSEDKRRSATA